MKIIVETKDIRKHFMEEKPRTEKTNMLMFSRIKMKVRTIDKEGRNGNDRVTKTITQAIEGTGVTLTYHFLNKPDDLIVLWIDLIRLQMLN